MDEIIMNKQVEELVDKLKLVRESYVENQKALKVSIRKDVVAVELKDILATNTDFYSLKNALETYIANLVQPNGE